MCQHHQHTENKDFVNENKIVLPDFTNKKQYRLADFFNTWWDEYCLHPAEYILPEQYKAVNAIRICRTEVLGVDYFVCPVCGEIEEVRHSCKNRFCPTCSWMDTIKWSEKIKQEMLDIPHRHVVVTLPHQLNGLLKKNKTQLLNILSRAAANTFKDWMKAKYGIKIGVIGVIHTYGEQKNLHPHIHMIVSWGGIDIKTGELVELKGKEQEFVNYTFVQKKFRIKYEDELIEMFDNDELKHNFIDRIDFMRFIKKINKKQWHINIEPPMQTPAEVILYIGRYSKRACLSEYKITNIEGEYISFTYKDYRDRENPDDPKSKAKEKILRLHYRKFFPRLLQHVPPPYFKMVKYYGSYARFKNIPQEYKTPITDEKRSENLEQDYQTSQNNPKYCSACTCEKIYVYTLLDRRPKTERNQAFDIEKHEHVIYVKLSLMPQEENLKKAA